MIAAAQGPDELLVWRDRVLRWRGRAFPCALGRGGVRAEKREGDGATPAGDFPLRRVLYRPDRTAPPETRLPVAPIAPDDGWCDDAGDAAYNRPVRLPHRASAEALWRDDGLYDIVVILGYNDAPVVRRRGSAIFLHVARPDYGPTEGCVALAPAHLLEILAGASSRTVMRVRAADAPD